MPNLNWLAFYDWVRSVFGFSYSRDLAAATVLSNLLRERGEPDLEPLIAGMEVSVVGAGPMLDEKVKEAEKLLRRTIVIAADGATSALLKAGITPRVVVTDLDGRLEDLLRASGEGAVTVVHAHGDNISALESYVPLFRGGLVGTCQVPPPPRLHVFGGFTDGDRAVVMALAMGASRVNLVGWSFEGVVGRYSKPSYRGDRVAGRVKRGKLLIAEYIVRQMREIYPGKIYWV